MKLHIIVLSVCVGLAAQVSDGPTLDGKSLRMWLLEFVDHSDREIRMRAERALRKYAETENAVEPLLSLMNDGDSNVRLSAAIAIPFCGEPARRVLPRLLDRLQSDDSPPVRAAIVSTLVREPFDKLDIVPALMKAYRSDKDASVRWAVINSIRHLTPPNEGAVSVLKEALYDSSREVRSQAAWAVTEIVPPELASRLLVGALPKEEEGNVVVIASCLGSLFPDSLPSVLAAIHDSNSSVRAGAAGSFAYANMSSKELKKVAGDWIVVIGQLLDDSDVVVRRQASHSIAALRSASRLPLQTITEHLQDTDIAVKGNLIRTLEAYSDEGEPVAAALVPLLRDANAGIRIDASIAIGSIGKTAKAAVPSLVELLQDQDVSVKWAAVDALGKLGTPSSIALPTLKKMSSSTDDMELQRRAKRAVISIEQEFEKEHR